ncbi:MAG: STAS domain-containing protein [Verrucomicrobia bacterium]|nr:STAS domain-containing protein [Verrucomicrobiota bacterium]
MNLNITRASDGQLKLAGMLDIYSATSLKESLQDALQSTGPMRLDLAEVTGGDVIGLQLLFSAHKATAAAGREFVVTAVSQSLKDAGASLGLSLDAFSNN